MELQCQRACAMVGAHPQARRLTYIRGCDRVLARSPEPLLPCLPSGFLYLRVCVFRNLRRRQLHGVMDVASRATEQLQTSGRVKRGVMCVRRRGHARVYCTFRVGFV